MRKLGTGCAILFALVVIYFSILAIISNKVPELGITNGRLKPCPDKPNCVSSEDADSSKARNRVQPLSLPGKDMQESWGFLRAAVVDCGGEVMQESAYYMRASFKVGVFRFVDDFEARLDSAAEVIHVRSASRVGNWDLGVNRKRVAQIAERYESLR